jgi:hypothetical protein
MTAGQPDSGSFSERSIVLRPFMPDDEGAARALVQRQFAGTPYLPRLVEQLETALQFEDPEYMALLAVDEADDTLLALAMFGAVAGARQCVKVHAVLGLDEPAMSALVAGVAQLCEHSGERLAVCELPDDLAWTAGADLLLANGYREEGRVPDHVRDGVALRLLVWRP